MPGSERIRRLRRAPRRRRGVHEVREGNRDWTAAPSEPGRSRPTPRDAVGRARGDTPRARTHRPPPHRRWPESPRSGEPTPRGCSGGRPPLGSGSRGAWTRRPCRAPLAVPRARLPTLRRGSSRGVTGRLLARLRKAERHGTAAAVGQGSPGERTHSPLRIVAAGGCVPQRHRTGGRQMAAEKTAVTVIGLGLMGSALAQAFSKAGHELTVWNRSVGKTAPFEGSARIARTVQDAVAGSSTVVVSLLDYGAASSILRTPEVERLIAGTTVVQLTTGTPADARESQAGAR